MHARDSHATAILAHVIKRLRGTITWYTTVPKSRAHTYHPKLTNHPNQYTSIRTKA